MSGGGVVSARPRAGRADEGTYSVCPSYTRAHVAYQPQDPPSSALLPYSLRYEIWVTWVVSGFRCSALDADPSESAFAVVAGGVLQCFISKSAQGLREPFRGARLLAACHGVVAPAL